MDDAAAVAHPPPPPPPPSSDNLDHDARDAQRCLDLAPTFLSLHHQAAHSTQLLDSLHSFLSTFQSDLSSLSSHISALQNTSHAIDTRLDARTQLEADLATLLSEISLSPRVVDLFFDSEPDQKVELWKRAVGQLERVLEATKVGAPPLLPHVGPANDTQAVNEAREVAETCRNIVASKLRTFLLSPYAAIRSSVTTNLQVLQTSILLQHHRPFYAFLARQLPRVAIDVQRTYVAAARLYFETAFRRYARSFGTIKARWSENAGGLISDPSSSSSSAAGGSGAVAATGAAAMAFLSRSGSSSQASRGAGAAAPGDPWEMDLARLENARLDGPGIVLGYMADDSSFKASPESLFRAISLVMVDNSCSEYTFLVRFFENLQEHEQSQEQEPEKRDASTRNDDVARQAGDDGDETVATLDPVDAEAEPEPEPEPSVVQLSRSEQAQMKGRGASDEIFKQVLEPALSTWSTFTKSLLSPPPPLLSLLTMLRLNDVLIRLVQRRGCTTPLLESALMGFKIQAFPLLKRQFDEQIDAVRRLHAGSSAGGGLATATATAAASGLGGLFRAAVGGSAGTDPAGREEVRRLVATRYAALFTRMVWLFEEEDDDQGLFANLLRLRTEVEKLLSTPPPSGSESTTGLYETVLRGLEGEMSHWNEAVRLRRSS